MPGSRIQGAVTVKLVFCPLNDLFSRYLIAVLVKEISHSVNLLPAGITVLAGSLCIFPVKLLNIRIIIISILCFPEGSVCIHYIKQSAICGL